MNDRLEINCNYKYKTRLLAAAAKKIRDISICFVDRAPLTTVQVSIILFENIIFTIFLSSEVFTTLKNPSDSKTKLINSVCKS